MGPGITISSGQIHSANNTNQMGQGGYRPPMLHTSPGQDLGGWSGEVRCGKSDLFCTDLKAFDNKNRNTHSE